MGILIHSSSKEPFEFEILLRSPAFERIVFPFKDNLEKYKANIRLLNSNSISSNLKKGYSIFDEQKENC